MGPQIGHRVETTQDMAISMTLMIKSRKLFWGKAAPIVALAHPEIGKTQSFTIPASDPSSVLTAQLPNGIQFWTYDFKQSQEIGVIGLYSTTPPLPNTLPETEEAQNKDHPG